MLLRTFQRFLITAGSVTSLPLHQHDVHTDMRGLAKYLPMVGLFIGGLLLALCVTLTKLAILPAVASTFIAISWLLLSGGIHFDGLMDTADGIFSHRSPERMLEIMRDSRVGNFGVMTGFVVFILKIAGLFSIGNVLPALILIPAWSRWCECFAIGAFPYARAEGMGKIWHDTMQFPRDLLLAALAPMLATAFCGLHFGILPALLISGSTVIVGIAASFYLSSILRGHTGDTYGAVVELSEAGALVLLTLLSRV